MLAISPWQGGRLNHIYIVNVCIAFYPRRWMKRYRGPKGGRSQSTFILQISAVRKKWMVARENWELLEDAKCYFRILLRGVLLSPTSSSIFTSRLLMEAKTPVSMQSPKECTSRAFFRGLAQAKFRAGWPQAGCFLASRQSRGGTQRKRSYSHFARHFILSSDRATLEAGG